jgi:lysophospholipase L1-like esterase
LRKNLALLAASVAVTLLLAEAGLRILGVSFPDWYIEDPVLGGALRPGAHGRYRQEGDARVRINSAGMRDREHAEAKPPGTLRIAVLGDSFAEAMQVERERTFWSVLESRLNGCGGLAGRKPEVLNFGVSGYGTAQELLKLRRDVWRYDPDIVLLAFFSGNDVRNNLRALNSADVPYFELKDGRLVLDDSFRGRLASVRIGGAERAARAALASARNNLRVLQLASQVKAALKQRQAAHNVKAAGATELGIDDAVFAPPRDPQWEEAWRVTEALMVAMRDEVRARGRQFWVVTLSAGVQVHSDPAVRRAFAERIRTPDLFYPDNRIAALCEREGILVVTLAPALAAWAESKRTLLHGFPNATPGAGHWNETGNRVAGEMIAEKMCGEIGARRQAPGDRRTPSPPPGS